MGVVKLRTKLLVAAQLLFCFITYGSKAFFIEISNTRMDVLCGRNDITIYSTKLEKTFILRNLGMEYGSRIRIIYPLTSYSIICDVLKMKSLVV